MKRINLFLALLALWILPGLSQAKDRTIYYHTDALGSVVAATDEHGDVLWRESYKPFGARQKREVGTEQNTPFYTGKPHDDITGLSYFGARYYDPEIGRFMGIDPVGVDPANLHSFNRYAYANNNPYRFVDPDGMEPNPVWSLPDPTWNAIYSPSNNIQGDWIPDSPPNWYVRNRESVYTGLSIATSINPKGVMQTITELPALLRKITKKADQGVIYRVPGSKTETGMPYIGSTDDLAKRAKSARDGRDRTSAEIIDAYPKGNRAARRTAEQRAMNGNGGVSNLDNKRNEIAPSKWKAHGVE